MVVAGEFDIVDVKADEAVHEELEVHGVVNETEVFLDLGVAGVVPIADTGALEFAKKETEIVFEGEFFEGGAVFDAELEAAGLGFGSEAGPRTSSISSIGSIFLTSRFSINSAQSFSYLGVPLWPSLTRLEKLFGVFLQFDFAEVKDDGLGADAGGGLDGFEGYRGQKHGTPTPAVRMTYKPDITLCNEVRGLRKQRGCLGTSRKPHYFGSLNGYSNLSDPHSLPSLLRSGKIDTLDDWVVLNANRLLIFDFAYPFTFDQLTIGMKSPEKKTNSVSTAFLVRPFDTLTWTSTTPLNYSFLIILFLLQRCRFLVRLRPQLERFIDFLFDVFVGIVCSFYATELRATAADGRALQEMPTFALLAERVARKEYSLVTGKVNDFRFEYINSSSLNDVQKLRKALQLNPPRVIKESLICEFLCRSTSSQTYFALDLKENLLNHCEKEIWLKKIELLLVRVPDMAWTMGSFVFSPAAEPVRQKVGALSAHGLFATEQTRIARRLNAVRTVVDDGDDEQEPTAGSDDRVIEA